MILRALSENPAERFLRIGDFLSAIKSSDFESSKQVLPQRPSRKKTALKFALSASAIAALSAIAFFILKAPQNESGGAAAGADGSAPEVGAPFDWGEFLIFGKTDKKFDEDRRDLEIILSRKTGANEAFKKAYPKIRKDGLKSEYGDVESYESFLRGQNDWFEACRRDLEMSKSGGNKFFIESSLRQVKKAESDIENPYKYILKAHADFSRMLENKKSDFNLEEILKE